MQWFICLFPGLEIAFPYLGASCLFVSHIIMFGSAVSVRCYQWWQWFGSTAAAKIEDMHNHSSIHFLYPLILWRVVEEPEPIWFVCNMSEHIQPCCKKVAVTNYRYTSQLSRLHALLRLRLCLGALSFPLHGQYVVYDIIYSQINVICECHKTVLQHNGAGREAAIFHFYKLSSNSDNPSL